MLIVREVFTAKPGQSLKLAKLCKKAFGGDPAARTMTDIDKAFVNRNRKSSISGTVK